MKRISAFNKEALSTGAKNLTFFVLGLSILLWAGIDIANGIIRATWPTATAIILTAALEEDPDFADYKFVRVSAEYSVEGRRFTSSVFRSPSYNPFRVKQAETLVRTKYARGKTVRVHYNSDRPGIAFLEPWPKLGHIFCFIVGLFLTIAGGTEIHNLLTERNDNSSGESTRESSRRAETALATGASAQLQMLVQDTRRLRALSSDAEAFVYLFLERILGLSADAVRAAVTHGSDDGGIDAVHIDRQGAQVVGCDHLGAHIVACDYVDSRVESRGPVPRARLDRLIKTWIAIASSTDRGLTLNAAMRERIRTLHRYWASLESAEVPHDIYLVTNRERLGIDRVELERQMDYFTRHFYHYYEQADLVGALLEATQRPGGNDLQ